MDKERRTAIAHMGGLARWQKMSAEQRKALLDEMHRKRWEGWCEAERRAQAVFLAQARQQARERKKSE